MQVRALRRIVGFYKLGDVEVEEKTIISSEGLRLF